jgi:hypothetical protein
MVTANDGALDAAWVASPAYAAETECVPGDNVVRFRLAVPLAIGIWPRIPTMESWKVMLPVAEDGRMVARKLAVDPYVSVVCGAESRRVVGSGETVRVVGVVAAER